GRGMYAELDVRMPRIELWQARQQPLLQERRDGADVEHAARAVLTQLLHGLLQLGEPAAHPPQQQRALGAERDRAGAAPGQWPPQILLEWADVHADRCRCRV